MTSADAPASAPPPPAIVEFLGHARSTDVKTYAAAADKLRRAMAADPLRPGWHLIAPVGFHFDVNGPIFWKGQYHAFYLVGGLHTAGAPWWQYSARAHAVSDDMVHWKDLPFAMWPDSPWDNTSVFSGNTVIDDRGVPTFLYTGHCTHETALGVLARSRDGMITWEKKLVMDQRPYPGTPVHWDAQVWKEGDTWHQLTGGTFEGQGAALLWTSPDLETWTFRRRIFTSPVAGAFWELPYLIQFADRHVLIVGAMNHGLYWTGRYDPAAMAFTPDHPEPRRMDSTVFYAPNVHLTDRKDPDGLPRRILLGWIRTGDLPRPPGVPFWAGCMSLPRVLGLRDGRLTQEPAPELAALRGPAVSRGAAAIPANGTLPLKDLRGDRLEIELAIDPGNAVRCGLRVLAGDGTGLRTITLEAAGGELRSGDLSVPTHLAPGARVALRVFLDRCVAETFVNGQALTTIAQSAPDQCVELFAEGGEARLVSLSAWTLRAIWPTESIPR